MYARASAVNVRVTFFRQATGWLPRDNPLHNRSLLSRCGYYAWCRRPASRRAREDLDLTKQIASAMEPYLHAGVLVVDEIGYLAAPPDAANVLFQVVNQRYLRARPMVFTTNKPLAAWADVLHDADLAEAIIDRVLARGRFLELRDSSYRTRHLKRPTSPPSKPPSDRARFGGNRVPDFPEPTDR